MEQNFIQPVSFHIRSGMRSRSSRTRSLCPAASGGRHAPPTPLLREQLSKQLRREYS
jgi:hypothetical protein